ncbi:MAG: HAD family hydrolase [Rubrivivax sp.]|nr:HAD family hydrolase [Rubrivivax sp.]
MKLALFDLDHTLLPLDSDHAFGEYLVQIGWADAAEHRRRNDAFYQDYLAGTLDVAAYIEFATGAWRGRSPAEQQQLTAGFMRDIIEPALRDSARALVQRHRDQGERLALVTSTNDFITAPIAQRFGFETLIATELDRDGQGRVTGRIRGVPNLREGKVVKVQAWLASLGLGWDDFEAISCYSDSTNDLPLLERATHPVATNPAPALAAIAQERGWPLLHLFE